MEPLYSLVLTKKLSKHVLIKAKQSSSHIQKHFFFEFCLTDRNGSICPNEPNTVNTPEHD